MIRLQLNVLSEVCRPLQDYMVLRIFMNVQYLSSDMFNIYSVLYFILSMYKKMRETEARDMIRSHLKSRLCYQKLTWKLEDNEENKVYHD